MINEHDGIILRAAVLTDLSALRNLFRETVLSISRMDYSDVQLEAWASAWKNEDRWIQKFSQQQFFIAEKEDDIVGFASLAQDGYLDFLYVHKDFQGRGIAGKLLAMIVDHARQNQVSILTTDASITAYPFFRNKGFLELKRKTVIVNGVSMDNYSMQKGLV